MKLSMSHAVPTILSADLEVDGTIISEGEVHILGALKGNLTARKLVLGEGGKIEGKIVAESAVINGNFTGSILAKSVTLGRAASVTADIIYHSMEMETGAVYEGHTRQDHDGEINSGEVVELPIMKHEQLPKIRVVRGKSNGPV